MSKLILYHRTSEERAAQILREGFKDGTDTYGTGQEFSGVWLSDRPLDAADIGPRGDAPILLKVSLNLPEIEIDEYEWKSEGAILPGGELIPCDKGYREWLIPAHLVNAHSTIEIDPEDDEALSEVEL